MKKFIFLFLITSAASAQTFIRNNGIQIVNTGNVITNGEWVNDAGTSIKNNGSIITSENWTNNGTLSGTGGFVLNYATNKNFKPGSPAFGSLSKTGVGTALVTGSIHLTDTLLLNNGILKLGATDTLWMKSGLVQVSATSYVDGIMSNSGLGDKDFPLGRDGYSLPLKLVKFNASKATAIVTSAPVGYAAGPGVEALISFPYVWKVSEKIAADTSAYVEVSYPNTLPTVSNPIMSRAISGNKYASMGARVITNANNTVTVRSYSRGLIGTFTVAKGFPSDFKTDSLALVALYNATTGTGWTTKTNWLTSSVSSWFGVTVTGQSITTVSLPNNKLTGAVPDPLTDILSLQTLNLSTNAITAIPNFTESKQITTLNVSGNKLEFSSLQPNATLIKPGVAFTYTGQSDIGVTKSTKVDVGNSFSFTAPPEATGNIYKWKKNGVAVAGAISRGYSISSISRANMGQHICEITNSFIPGLTLKTAPETALAVASLEGKLFASSSAGATKGKMILFKVNSGAAYDTTAVQNIKSDGTFKIEKVVLDDYQIAGFADTLTYARALPTYYQNTIFWEEANTIPVNTNVSGLNITSNFIPTGGAKGVGNISGTLSAPVIGGREEAVKRVAGAGVSVRRVETTSKPLGEKLTLVAYVYTNSLGEFELPDLPKADYRLNIQYPGYPMDETSFVTIPIGDGLQSQVRVAANVESGKIKVDKLVITGLWEKAAYKANVFPNPTVSYIEIYFENKSMERSVYLLDVNGREIIKQNAWNQEERIDVQHLPTGIYFMSILESGSTVKSLRVVVQKD